MSVKLPLSGRYVRDGIAPDVQETLDRWILANGQQRDFTFWVHDQKGGSYSVHVRVDLASARPGAGHAVEGRVAGVPHLQITYVKSTSPMHDEQTFTAREGAHELSDGEIGAVLAGELPETLITWIAGELRTRVGQFSGLTDDELARSRIGI